MMKYKSGFLTLAMMLAFPSALLADAPAAQTENAVNLPVALKTSQKAQDRQGGKAPVKKPDTSTAFGDLYFKQITLDEAAQFISKIGKTSIVVTSSVSGKTVSLYLRNVSVEGMVKNLCRAAGVWYRFDAQSGVYILMNAEEYQQDIAITRDEITRTFVLRHHNVVSTANAVAALFGDRVNLVEPVEEMPPVDMGGSRRNQSSSPNSYDSDNWNNGGNNAYGSGTGNGYQSNWRSRSSRSSSTSYNANGSMSSRSGGSTSIKTEDVRKSVSTVSQEGLESSMDINASRTTSVDGASLLSATAKQGAAINITYNKLHNLLLVRTSDEAALKDIEALVKEMDKPPRQVLLEMRILEVELGNDFRSVFDIGGSGTTRSTGPQSLGAGTILGGATNAGGVTDYPHNAGSLGNFPTGASTALWQFVNDTLRLRLELLEGENRVNVLATPTLVAANNQPARLFIGDEQVLVTGASADSFAGSTGTLYSNFNVQTEVRNIGQTLVILPRINADRSVTLSIDQDNSRINAGGSTLPISMSNGQIYQYPIDTVNTANLQVTAHAQDGLTVAVGGMISQRISEAEEKVPLLGDLPLFGMLFKKTARANTRRQLVLLITPHVLDTPEESDALAQKKEEALKKLDSSDNSATRLKREGQHPSIFNPAHGGVNPSGGVAPLGDEDRGAAKEEALLSSCLSGSPEC